MHKERVRKFYDLLWNAHDGDAAPSVLHENVAFKDGRIADVWILGDLKRLGEQLDGS